MISRAQDRKIQELEAKISEFVTVSTYVINCVFKIIFKLSGFILYTFFDGKVQIFLNSIVFHMIPKNSDEYVI